MDIKLLNDLIKRIRNKNYSFTYEKRSLVNEIKENLKPGMKVVCHKMNDEPFPVPSETTGTVIVVDDIGNVHVDWENGSSLALILEIDDFEVIDK